MARDVKKKPPRKTASVPQNPHEQIRRRAYQLYEERGRDDGHDLDDWLRAEREVAGGRTRKSA